MPSSIDTIMTTYGNDTYYQEPFIALVRSYIPLLETRQITYQTPTNDLLVKYEGDFFGLLDNYGYEKQYFIFIMMFNNLRCSGDFSPSLMTISIPDLSYIDLLYSTYISSSVTS